MSIPSKHQRKLLPRRKQYSAAGLQARLPAIEYRH